jgi:predicted nucleotidyltransferase
MNIDHKIIFDGVFGSTLYGTNTPSSDQDFKAIFLPTAREIILGNGPTHFNRDTNTKNSKNTSEDVDREYYSLKYFIELASKGETIAIDMLHTPVHQNFAEPNATWNYIQKNRHRFYTTDMKAYLGYVKKQAAKYGIKGTRLAALRQVLEVVNELPNERHISPQVALDEAMQKHQNFSELGHISTTRINKIKDFKDKLPLNEFASLEVDEKGNEFYNVLGRKHQLTIRVSELKDKLSRVWDEYGARARQAETNEGIDWKALSHAYRGGIQLLEIYQTGDLKYPLSQASFVKQIKAGEINFKSFQECLEDLISDVDNACVQAAKNGMPAKVDHQFWENFVHNTHLHEVEKSLGYRC